MHVRNKTLIKHLPFSRGAGLVQGCKPNINTHDILSIQNTFQKFGTLTVPIGHMFIAHHSHKHGNFLRDVRFRLFCKKAEIRNSSALHCLSIKRSEKAFFFDKWSKDLLCFVRVCLCGLFLLMLRRWFALHYTSGI
jgi:hypothetical protein